LPSTTTPSLTTSCGFLSLFVRRTPPRREVNKIATERCPLEVGGGSGGGFSRGLSLSFECPSVGVRILWRQAGNWENGKAESVYRKRVRGAEVAAGGYHSVVLDLSA